MAFFDKFSETISNKSKDVVKKAKEMAEISSLNGQISSQEEIINKAYIEIGKSYFELHKDILDDTYAPQCNAVKSALVKVQQLKENINNIKGIQICPYCGVEVANDVTFCSGCGKKMVESEPEVVSEIEAEFVTEEENVEPKVEDTPNDQEVSEKHSTN